MVSVSPLSPFAVKPLLRVTALASIAVWPVLASAQIAAPAASPDTQTVAFSSSSGAQNPFAGEDIDGSSLASAPDGSTTKTIAPQYGGGYGGGRYHRYTDNSKFSHIAIEAGGGFTAPIGNDINGGFTSIFAIPGQPVTNYGTDTWGGNLLIGGGWNFSKRFALLGEYQFDANKIPGKTLSEYYLLANPTDQFSASGITNIGGTVHTNSITAEGVFYYYNSDKHSYAGYVIGGGGYYHKSVNFSAPVVEESFFGEFVTNQNFSSYANSAGGVNFGTGVSFKPFGQDSRAKIFAEARYVFVDTPRETTADLANGNLNTGTEELIPITFGIRF